MLTKRSSLILIVGALFFWGCQPKPNSADLLKKMVVTTDFNSTANFGDYSKYWLSLDTISYFLNTDNDPTDTLAIGGAYASLATKVSSKMTDAGYTLTGKNSSPDLWVHIYVVENYSAQQSYYYNPYSYGYYGGYYGGYSSTVSVSDQANLYIFIIDLKHKSSGKSYIWGCNIGDLISSPDQTLTPIFTAIDQAFAQSSYIKK
jgi:hypothetical protein